MTQIIALHGGGDWYDANASYLVLPENIDLDAEWKKYRKWYREVYCAKGNRDPYGNSGKRIQYVTFYQWLQDHCGAEEPDESELRIFNTH